MLNSHGKGYFVIIPFLFIVFIFSHFTFDTFAQLSPEDQALFDQSAKNAQSSLEQQKQKQKQLQEEQSKDDIDNDIETKTTSQPQQQKTSHQFFNSDSERIRINAKFKVHSNEFIDNAFPPRGHSISISINNTLCPENNCKLSLIETELRESFTPLEYVFEGNIQVGTNTDNGVRNKLYHFYSLMEVTESVQIESGTTCYISGAFDIYEGSSYDFGYPDYAYEIRTAELEFQNGLPILKMEAEEKGLVESILG